MYLTINLFSTAEESYNNFMIFPSLTVLELFPLVWAILYISSYTWIISRGGFSNFFAKND